MADSWALLAKPKSQEVGDGLKAPPRCPTGPDGTPPQGTGLYASPRTGAQPDPLAHC